MHYLRSTCELTLTIELNNTQAGCSRAQVWYIQTWGLTVAYS